MRSNYGVGPLPLVERLAGWKVEKRQRPHLERYDKVVRSNLLPILTLFSFIVSSHIL